MRIGLRLVNPGMAAKTSGKLSVILELCDFSVCAQRVAELNINKPLYPSYHRRREIVVLDCTVSRRLIYPKTEAAQ
jgi:hypothetical protein